MEGYPNTYGRFDRRSFMVVYLWATRCIQEKRGIHSIVQCIFLPWLWRINQTETVMVWVPPCRRGAMRLFATQIADGIGARLWDFDMY